MTGADQARYHISIANYAELKNIRADLHIHTSHSDGLLSPAEVVHRAHAGGLDVIAITDHDAVGGLKEASSVATKLGMRLVPGAELSAIFKGAEIHLLAYFPSLETVDQDSHPSLSAFLTQVQAARRQRIVEAVRALRMRGLFLTERDVFGTLQNGRSTSPCESFGRLHLARALKNAGYVRTADQAFSRYLKGGVVGSLEVDAVDVIRLVHSANGLVIWAHPRPDEVQAHLDALVAAGLDGLESHNFRRPDTTGCFSSEIQNHGLLATGGSDWHGGKSEAPLGTHAVGDDIGRSFLKALDARRAA